MPLGFGNKMAATFVKSCIIGTPFQSGPLSLLMALACVLGANFSTAAQTLADALDTTNLVTTGGDAVWFAQTTNTYDGVDAVRNGAIGTNQTSWIETTVVGPTTVSFWVRVSFGSSDFPPFYTSFTINGNSPDGVFGLSSFWSQQTYDVGAGTNVLRMSVSNPFGGVNQGFMVLDEFNLSPPRPLTINSQPYDTTVYSGEMTALVVWAIGTPPIQYQWQCSGTNIPGATNRWISWEAASTNDSGIYSVIVSNSQGSVTSSNALLTVLPPTAPFFTYEPESVTAYSGQDLYLWADVDGSPPFVFQWRKEGTNLPGANWSSLLLTNISLADAGSYTLVVSNSLGGIESSNAMLTVMLSVAPVITRHPRSLEVAEGVNTWMSVAATGAPDPSYTWTRIGDFPPPPPPISPPTPANPSPTRTFNNVTTNDAGVYFAAAQNYGGAAVSRSALLTVLPPLNLKGSWGQGAEDIFVTNGLAFLAQGTNGLAILSVSNPASPQLLGSFSTTDYARKASVSGGLAFVAEGYAGLQIISVTNPFNPVLVGAYNTAGYAYDIAVRSNLVFVADGNSGLLILSVSNPASPAVVGGYSTNLSPSHIGLSGNYAYLTALFTGIGPGSNHWVNGMLVMDISNPAQPAEVGRFETGIGALDAHDQLIFTGNSVISVTNPAQPSAIGSFTYHFTNSPPVFRLSPGDIRVLNNLAYVIYTSDTQSELIIYDVHDSAYPIPVGYFATPGHAYSLWVDGNFVYVASYDSPLLIIETPFNPQPVSPTALSLAQQNGLKLHLQGQRGFNYTIEYADGLLGFPWQSLQTILLTNQSSTIEVPTPSGMRFFRAKQLD